MLNMVFLFCAGVGIVIMLIQFGLMLLGLGDDFDGDAGGDFDAEFDADADFDADHQQTTLSEAADADVDHPGANLFFQIVSLKGLVAAAAFFGLGGLWAQASGMSDGASIALACVLGLTAMYGVYWLMKQLYKLKSSGTVNIHNARGRDATIYIPVPPNGEGKGKVQMRLQGRTYEFEAVTDQAETLATGQSVVVTGILGSDLVKVAPVKEEATTTA